MRNSFRATECHRFRNYLTFCWNLALGHVCRWTASSNVNIFVHNGLTKNELDEEQGKNWKYCICDGPGAVNCTKSVHTRDIWMHKIPNKGKSPKSGKCVQNLFVKIAPIFHQLMSTLLSAQPNSNHLAIHNAILLVSLLRSSLNQLIWIQDQCR